MLTTWRHERLSTSADQRIGKTHRNSRRADADEETLARHQAAQSMGLNCSTQRPAEQTQVPDGSQQGDSFI